MCFFETAYLWCDKTCCHRQMFTESPAGCMIDRICMTLMNRIAVLATSALLLLSGNSCDNREDIGLPTGDVIVRKVAVVAPIGDNATKKRLQRTAEWFSDNFREAQQTDTIQVRLELEWYDESGEDLVTLSHILAGREDITAILGPFGNESMSMFAPACRKTLKPLIAPTVTSEEIMRRFAVSTAGNRETVNKEPFFWPLCQTDVVLTETMLRHYVKQTGENGLNGNLKCAFFSPADKFGETFFNWAPFHARNLNVDLNSNRQYSSTPELLDCLSEYQDLPGVNDSPSAGFCVIETARQLSESAGRIKHYSTYYVFPSLSEEGLAAPDIQSAGSLEGVHGFSPYANPATGFEQAYTRRFGVMPTFAECKFYDALLLAGLAAVLYEHIAGYLTNLEYKPSVSELINTMIIMMCSEHDYGEDGREAETHPIWETEGMSGYLESVLSFEAKPFFGASGYIMFDSETRMQIARTTYVYWQIEGGRILHRAYYGPDGDHIKDNTVSWEPAYDEVSALKDFAEMASDGDLGISYPALTGQYAVLVQGSNGMNNYRHQADVLSVYQMLRQNGYDDDHIILIIDGALAYDPQNNESGVIRNNMLGHDLLGGTDHKTNQEWSESMDGFSFFDTEYPPAIVDYDTDTLSAADIAHILEGRESQHLPVVLPQDEGLNILLYWSGHGRNVSHGGTDELVWRETGAGLGMTASLLRQTVEQMSFRKLLAIVEPCYSEGVILPLQGLTGVLAMSGASGDEQSWAENWNPILGRYGTWMYDRFTRNVVNFLTDNPTASYRDFYLYCMQNTIGSHVKLVNAGRFGNLYRTGPGEFTVVFDKPDEQREFTHSVVAGKGGIKFNDENRG